MALHHGGRGATTLDGLDGYTVATSFPGSPSTGDRCFRTDRNIEYVYDGTRWLSTQILTLDNQVADGASADGFARLAVPFKGTYSLWLVSWSVGKQTSAAGEWDVILASVDAAGTVTTIDTFDGSADADGAWIGASRTLGALVAADAEYLRVAADEISGTAVFYAGVSIHYRLVG